MTGSCTSAAASPPTCISTTAQSRVRHAIIVPHGSGHRILDDRSLNGTFVNGQRIEQADLHDNDVMTFGHFELIYHEV
jgi:pSer/pThr/pTyr-binding forkhead associated (FHA) protein